MKGVIIPVTSFQQNCSLIWCERTMRGAVVDPGGDLDRIEQAVADNKVTLEKILVTHGHLDHASGVADLAERHALPVEGPHREDRFWIDQIPESARRYGFPPARAFTPGSALTPGRWLDEGDEVTFGEERLAVHHCPGHTPGHVVYFHAGLRLALVGDVLFRGSIGRTDFPRGNHAELINAIRGKLWPLGDDVTFVPGHGPLSTFGEERQSNPFVGDAVIGAALAGRSLDGSPDI